MMLTKLILVSNMASTLMSQEITNLLARIPEVFMYYNCEHLQAMAIRQATKISHRLTNCHQRYKDATGFHLQLQLLLH